MYVTTSSLAELRERLEITAREALKCGVTWSISKFFAGRETNIVSGHQVILDPSGKQQPLVGRDPARVEKLTNIKQVYHFLGLVNQFGKFSPDYSMTMAKIRTLLKTGVKFEWNNEHCQNLRNCHPMTLIMTFLP